MAQRLTSRSHPHRRGLWQRRARTTRGALPEKAACATFNLRATASERAQDETSQQPPHTVEATCTPPPSDLFPSSFKTPAPGHHKPLHSKQRRRRWRGGPKANLAQPPAQARAEAATRGFIQSPQVFTAAASQASPSLLQATLSNPLPANSTSATTAFSLPSSETHLSARHRIDPSRQKAIWARTRLPRRSVKDSGIPLKIALSISRKRHATLSFNFSAPLLQRPYAAASPAHALYPAPLTSSSSYEGPILAIARLPRPQAREGCERSPGFPLATAQRITHSLQPLLPPPLCPRAPLSPRPCLRPTTLTRRRANSGDRSTPTPPGARGLRALTRIAPPPPHHAHATPLTLSTSPHPSTLPSPLTSSSS